MTKQEIKTLEELVKLRKDISFQSNSNILQKQGIQEKIAEFQKPITNKLDEIEAKKTDNNPQPIKDNEISQFQNYFGIEIDTPLGKLSETVKPKMRYNNGDKEFIINKQIIPLVKDGDNYIFDYGDRKFEMTKGIAELIFGSDTKQSQPNDLENYKYILSKAGVTNRTPRFKYISEKMGTGATFVPVDLTNKNPVDLFIELRKLLEAKKAGNNNQLGKASVILDHLLETKNISTDKHKSYIAKFSAKK